MILSHKHDVGFWHKADMPIALANVRFVENSEHGATVMAGLVPAIHVLFLCKGVDARHKAGHDK